MQKLADEDWLFVVVPGITNSAGSLSHTHKSFLNLQNFPNTGCGSSLKISLSFGMEKIRGEEEMVLQRNKLSDFELAIVI